MVRQGQLNTTKYEMKYPVIQNHYRTNDWCHTFSNWFIIFSKIILCACVCMWMKERRGKQEGVGRGREEEWARVCSCIFLSRGKNEDTHAAASSCVFTCGGYLLSCYITLDVITLTLGLFVRPESIQPPNKRPRDLHISAFHSASYLCKC